MLKGTEILCTTYDCSKLCNGYSPFLSFFSPSQTGNIWTSRRIAHNLDHSGWNNWQSGHAERSLDHVQEVCLWCEKYFHNLEDKSIYICLYSKKVSVGAWILVISPEISVKSRAKLPQCPSKGTSKYFVYLSMNIAFSVQGKHLGKQYNSWWGLKNIQLNI